MQELPVVDVVSVFVYRKDRVPCVVVLTEEEDEKYFKRKIKGGVD